MPRLRYLKHYEELAENDNDNQRSFEAGQSWLSNATIISSLSEAKIKQAITYYYQMAHLLESEIRSRSIRPRLRPNKISDVDKHPLESNIQLVREKHRQAPRSRGNTKNRTRKINRTKGIFQGLNLPSDLQYKLRQTLRKELNHVCEAQT